ncbi:hypothetical protein BCR34DRAFT_573284 [Clohesyomyces aquaticus]|uniref:Uncharacterized protein n=1 Tax=Clohesyomyces aquaticus TaxID=1231657 RepID=A0A1Y1Z0C2_9PLEO|nr:hypothetical protein BCR34DRAFT_573284 [Clohesyomyces aquaticus]
MNNSSTSFDTIYAKGRDVMVAPTFFSLARELRDRIYHYMWQDTKIYFTQFAIEFAIAYGVGVEHPLDTALPVWLLTDKRMLSEGMEQFYRHAECIYHQHSLHVFAEEGSDFECVGEHECPSERAGQLLDIRRVRTLAPDQNAMNMLAEVPQGVVNVLADFSLPKSALESSQTTLMRHLLHQPNTLRKVSMSFRFPDQDEKEWAFSRLEPYPVYVDLSCFESLGVGMDDVSISLKYPRIVEGEYMIPEALMAFPLVQREMLRVAMALTKKEGEDHGWAVEDCIHKKHGTSLPEWSVRVRRGPKGSHCELAYTGLVAWASHLSCHTPSHVFIESDDVCYRESESGEIINIGKRYPPSSLPEDRLGMIL